MALLSPEFVNRPSTLLETPQIRRRKPPRQSPSHRPARPRGRATRHPRASGDGWHRVMAAEQIDALDIPAELRAGGRVDALKHALGANAVHGQRRSPADKRRCVELALNEFPNMTQGQIADLVGCSREWVNRVSPKDVNSSQPARTVTGTDGKQYPAHKPRRPSTPEEEEAAAQNGGRSTGFPWPLPPPRCTRRQPRATAATMPGQSARTTHGPRRPRPPSLRSGGGRRAAPRGRHWAFPLCLRVGSAPRAPCSMR